MNIFFLNLTQKENTRHCSLRKNFLTDMRKSGWNYWSENFLWDASRRSEKKIFQELFFLFDFLMCFLMHFFFFFLRTLERFGTRRKGSVPREFFFSNILIRKTFFFWRFNFNFFFAFQIIVIQLLISKFFLLLFSWHEHLLFNKKK